MWLRNGTGLAATRLRARLAGRVPGWVSYPVARKMTGIGTDTVGDTWMGPSSSFRPSVAVVTHWEGGNPLTDLTAGLAV